MVNYLGPLNRVRVLDHEFAPFGAARLYHFWSAVTCHRFSLGESPPRCGSDYKLPHSKVDKFPKAEEISSCSYEQLLGIGEVMSSKLLIIPMMLGLAVLVLIGCNANDSGKAASKLPVQ